MNAATIIITIDGVPFTGIDFLELLGTTNEMFLCGDLDEAQAATWEADRDEYDAFMAS